MAELTRDMASAAYREVIESYFKKVCPEFNRANRNLEAMEVFRRLWKSFRIDKRRGVWVFSPYFV